MNARLPKRKRAKEDSHGEDMEVDSEENMSDHDDGGAFFMNDDEQDESMESSGEDTDSDDGESDDEDKDADNDDEESEDEDEDDDADNDDEESEDGIEEDMESEENKVVKQIVPHPSSAKDKTKRLSALADFVTLSSAETSHVKGILKSDIKSAKQQKQVQFMNNASDAANDSLIVTSESSVHEDIYGRLRDKQGNVITTPGNPPLTGSTYVPPGKRQQLLESKLAEGEKKNEEDILLTRQLKGQINRLVNRKM